MEVWEQTNNETAASGGQRSDEAAVHEHTSSLFLTLKLYLENVVMRDGALRLGADA